MNKKFLLGIIGIIFLVSVGTIAVIASNVIEENYILKENIENEATDTETEIIEESVLENDFRIMELKNNGILIGDERGDLLLEENLKRQEMVVLIARLMGKDEEAKKWDTSKLTFADIGKDNWAAGYIAWAKDNNITKGYSEEWFGYNDTLTEEQAGTFILRVLGYEEAELENATDIASEIGLIGYYDILEKEAIKRGEVGIMIYNGLYLHKKEGDVVLGEELKIKSIFEGNEREIAVILKDKGIEYNAKIEAGEWEIIYVDLKGKEINKENVEEESDIFYLVGNFLGYKPYAIIDINTGKKIEVISYEEYGVIYQIKVDGEEIYNYLNK